ENSVDWAACRSRALEHRPILRPDHVDRRRIQIPARYVVDLSLANLLDARRPPRDVAAVEREVLPIREIRKRRHRAIAIARAAGAAGVPDLRREKLQVLVRTACEIPLRRQKPREQRRFP